LVRSKPAKVTQENTLTFGLYSAYLGGSNLI